MEFLHWENTYVKELNHVERKKYLQKVKVIKYLYVEEAKSSADICNRFGISLPTSVALLNELIGEGLVEKQGRGKSGGGRKPDLYGLLPNSLFVLGIDMGMYETKMAIFNNDKKNITGIHTFPIRLDNDPQTIEQLYQYANTLIQNSGIDQLKLINIGISMPGLVDSKAGINYTHLHVGNKPLRQLLEARFNRPVYIENDARAMTLAECRFGLAHGRKNVLTVFMDWGIGLGMIINGKLSRGTSGFAGEFSHIPFVENGLLCTCGKLGCLQTVASGTALVRLAKEGILTGKHSIIHTLANQDPDKIDQELIIEAAMKGDQFAISLLAQIGFDLGKGISVLIQLFNPELIVLGGKLALANQYILSPVQQAVNMYCLSQIREKTSIVISNLGPKAGIMGSVAMVMENIYEHYIE